VRGCLFVVVLGAALLGIGLWFGAPPLATALVRSSLTAAGFESGQPAEVEVLVATPLELLSGRVGRVTIEAVDARFGGVRARTAAVALDDVDLVGARAASIELDLGEPSLVRTALGVDLDADRLTARGPVGDAEMELTFRAEQFAALAEGAFVERFGSAPESIALEAPDILVARVLGQEVRATVRVEAGALVVDPVEPDLDAVVVFEPDSDLPLTFEAVRVEAGRLVLAGRIDLSDLLG
jgi:hypothetical protein